MATFEAAILGLLILGLVPLVTIVPLLR